MEGPTSTSSSDVCEEFVFDRRRCLFGQCYSLYDIRSCYGGEGNMGELAGYTSPVDNRIATAIFWLTEIEEGHH